MRARSLAGFAALALAIAVASPVHAAGRGEPLDPAGAAIDVMLDRAHVKYLAPDITADIAHGDCDSCLAFHGDSHPYGLYDFRIDADGYLYILDSINHKILILDDRLRFHCSIQLDSSPDRFGEIGSLIYIKMMRNDDDRIVDRRRASATRFDPDEMKTGPDLATLWTYDPNKTWTGSAGATPWAPRRDYDHTVAWKQDVAAGKVGTWHIRRAEPAGPHDRGYLMYDHLVDNTINFGISYVHSFSPYQATQILYRINVSGEVAGAIELSPAFETIHSNARCGPDNTVVAVDVTDTCTHVRRWNGR